MSPDGSPKPPPEEKLLRLIRAKGFKPAVAAAAPAGPSAVAVLRAAGPARTTLPWLQAVVALLAVILAGEAGWLVWQAVQPPDAAATAPLQLPVAPTDTPPPAPPVELPSLAASAARPLFTALAPSAGGSDGAPKAPARPASGAAKELASRLSLNGIMGGDPAQAIIEDGETKRTYFVTPGQAVAEGAVVEEVSEELKRVILDLNGEKIELTL